MQIVHRSDLAFELRNNERMNIGCKSPFGSRLTLLWPDLSKMPKFPDRVESDPCRGRLILMDLEADHGLELGNFWITSCDTHYWYYSIILDWSNAKDECPNLLEPFARRYPGANLESWLYKVSQLIVYMAWCEVQSTIAQIQLGIDAAHFATTLGQGRVGPNHIRAVMDRTILVGIDKVPVLSLLKQYADCLYTDLLKVRGWADDPFFDDLQAQITEEREAWQKKIREHQAASTLK